MRTAKLLLVPAFLLALMPLSPRAHARSQELLPALVGGAAGLAAGGYVSIGIVTLQARRGEFLFSSADALGWQATPVLVGSGVGFFIGLFDEPRLRRTIVGGAAGGIVGTGVGVLFGLTQWSPPEGKWAGGVVGGAAGILAGSLVGALWPEKDNDPAAPATGASVPIGVSFSF